MKMSKIVQIACSEPQDAEGHESRAVFALADDGKVYRLHEQVPAKNKDGDVVGVWSQFWRPMPSLDVEMPVFAATVSGVTERTLLPRWFADRAKKAAAAAAGPAGVI